MNEETPWPGPPARGNPWSEHPPERPGEDPTPRAPDDATDETAADPAAPDGSDPSPVLPTPPNKWATGAPIAPPGDSLTDYDHPLTPSSPPEWYAARPGPADTMSGPGERDLAEDAPPKTPGVADQRPSSYVGGPVDAGVLGDSGAVPPSPSPPPVDPPQSQPGSPSFGQPSPFGSPSSFGSEPPPRPPSASEPSNPPGPPAHGTPAPYASPASFGTPQGQPPVQPPPQAPAPYGSPGHQPLPAPPPPPSAWSGAPTGTAPTGAGPTGGPAGWSDPQGWTDSPGWGATPAPLGSPTGGGGFGSPPLPAPAPRSVRADRAPAWVRGLAGLIIFALAGGAAYLLTQGGPSFPSEFDERVAPLAEWVAAERGLEFEHAVEVNFLTPEEYTEAITGGESVEVDAEIDEELETATALLRALGLLEGEVNLAEASETLMDSGSLAFYSPETKQVYVRGTELTPALEVTLVHELVHVVQDQHFDLSRIGDLESGEADVLRALVEGDATRIEQRYVWEELSDEEREDYFAESQASADESQAVLEESVPPVLTAVFAAPYMFGPAYITYLEATGGNAAVDEALVDVPIERHLYNPIDIDRVDSPAPSPTIEPPGGIESMEDGEFGQITWFLLLSARLDSDAALAATDQIFEDHYVAYRQDDLVCVRIHATTWDDPGLLTLVGALEAWKAAAPAQQVDIDVRGSSVVLETCDPGADSGIAADVTVDTLIVPVARTQVYAELLGSGLGFDVASCGATRVVEILDPAELTAPEGELDPGQQRRIIEAMAGCR